MKQQSPRPGNDLPTRTRPATMRARWWFAIGVVCVLLMGAAL